MAELDRPKRPQAHESLLLDELDTFTFDQSKAIDYVLNYADDLEEYCDKLDFQIVGLMDELGSARRDLSEQSGLRNQLDEAKGMMKRLEARIEDQKKTIEALAGAMGDDEREEYEKKLAESERNWKQVVDGRDHHIQQLSQELALAQVKLGGIQLILR